MVKTMTLKFAGKCRDCGRKLAKGDMGKWFGRGGGIACATGCRDAAPSSGYLSRDAYTGADACICGLQLDTGGYCKECDY